MPMDFDVKTEIAKVLDELEMGDKRPAKMDNDDFLKYRFGS